MAGSWVEGRGSLPTHNALCGTWSLVLCAQHVSADKCFMLSSQNPPSFPNAFSFCTPHLCKRNRHLTNSPSQTSSHSPPNPIMQTKKVPSYLTKKQNAQRTRVVEVGEWKTQLRDPDYSHPPFYNIVPEKKKSSHHWTEETLRFEDSVPLYRCDDIRLDFTIWIQVTNKEVWYEKNNL